MDYDESQKCLLPVVFVKPFFIQEEVSNHEEKFMYKIAIKSLHLFGANAKIVKIKDGCLRPYVFMFLIL